MFKKFAACLGLALIAGVICAQAQDKPTDETIKIDTRLVSVPVVVSDRDGRFIPNLTAANFTVLQDGSPQNIEFFASVEEPLTIALLIDTSQSTRGVLGDIKDSAKSFIKLLSPQDRAMIISFDYDTHILTPLTSDQEQLKKAIRSAEIPDREFGTTLRDAAYQTVTRSFAGIKGRKAIILLTDGKDAGSYISTRELLYSLEESDTLIYTIFFKTEEMPPQVFNRFPGNGGRYGGIWGNGNPGGRGGRFPGGRDNPRRRERVERENEAAQEFLQKLSDTTAGRFYASKNGKLKTLFATIVEELKFQYRLGFYPPEDAGGQTLHNIRVKVARPDAVVRSRNSYRTQNRSN